MPEEAAPAVEVLRRIGGEHLVTKIMATFVPFGDDCLHRLQQQAADESAAGIASAAHALKSSARQIGALRLGEACAAVEKAGRAGDLQAARAGIPDIEQLYTDARPWISALAARATG
jgi:HPt (histidine-containing phosphotransfer) domain-containing protein